ELDFTPVGGSVLPKAQLLESSLDGLSDHAMRMRVNGSHRSRLPNDGNQCPARRSVPIRQPPTAFAVTQGACPSREELADRGAQAVEQSSKERVVEASLTLSLFEQNRCLLQGDEIAGFKPALHHAHSGAIAGQQAMQGDRSKQRDDSENDGR